MTLKDIIPYIRNNDTILDIGAGAGANSVYFATHTGAKKIYAFEVRKDLCDALCKNIEIGKFEHKIVPHNFGFGVYTSYASICDIKRLDDVKIPDPIDFIRIDGMCAETTVLMGARETIFKDKPLILLEIIPESMEKIDKIFKDLGYCRFKKVSKNGYIFKSVVKCVKR
jgi:precorrin-6B methylase 2